MQDTVLQKRPLFNFLGSDIPEDVRLFNGNPTGISNVNHIKYGWSEEFWLQYQRNVWFPTKVSLMSDMASLPLLTPEELLATERTLSFLIFLDSYQSMALPSLGQYITDPNTRDAITLQTAQEVVHSKSYQYILNTLFSTLDRDKIYNWWKDDVELLKRIDWVANIAKEFESNPCEDTRDTLLSATFALEGIFFYHGFVFFYHLAQRGRLVGVSEIIEYIEADELSHVGLFANIIKNTFNSPVQYEKLAKILKEATAHEISWAKYNYGGNKILGITESSIVQYMHYLCNQRCSAVGIDDIYPKTSNPYEFLKSEKKKDFFAGTVVDYDRADSLDGWNLILEAK